MVTINNQFINHIAHLSRLKIEDDKIQELKKDMVEILSFVEKLSELDTQKVEPLSYINHDKVNRLREDIAEKGMEKKDIFQSAPKHDGDYFKVPKFINK